MSELALLLGLRTRPDRIVKLDGLFPITRNQKLDISKVERLTLSEIRNDRPVSNLRSQFTKFFTEMIGPLDDTTLNFFEAGGKSLDAVQISHLLRHPSPVTFLASLKNKTLENILADLGRYEEFQINSSKQNETDLTPRALQKATKKVFRIENSFKTSKTNFDKIWSHPTGSCSDGDIELFKFRGGNYVISSAHDGTILCIDLLSGELVFRVKLSNSKPNLVQATPAGIIATLESGEIMVLDPTNGQPLAVYKSSRIHCPGLFHQNFLYQPVVSETGPSLCQFLTPSRPNQNFELVAEQRLPQTVNAKPIEVNGAIFILCLKGHFRRFTDKKYVDLEGVYFNSPVYHNGQLILLDVRGKLTFLSLELSILRK